MQYSNYYSNVKNVDHIISSLNTGNGYVMVKLVKCRLQIALFFLFYRYFQPLLPRFFRPLPPPAYLISPNVLCLILLCLKHFYSLPGEIHLFKYTL